MRSMSRFTAFSAPAPPLPEFPPELPQLAVETLSLSKLLENDSNESKRLLRICCSTGLFHLQLTGTTQGSKLVKEVDQLFHLSKNIFSLLPEVKQRYSSLDGTDLGYTAAGGIDSKGTEDCCENCEMWCISKDDVIGQAPILPAPGVVNAHRELYAAFAKSCHEISMVILDRLEPALALPTGILRSLHRITELSSDLTRQIMYSPQPKSERRTRFPSHTDSGSVTVLFNVLGGLQVLPEQSKSIDQNWLWVKPVPQCATVNLGDAMVRLTNGLIKSPLHRVVDAPGDQGMATRYSLAYFTKPEDGSLMDNGSRMVSPNSEEDEKDSLVTAGECIRMKIAQAQEERTICSKRATTGFVNG